MSKKIFDFKTQMAIGDKGEADFIKSYPELAPKKSKEREVDFYLKDNSTVELKTDDYSMDATPNFFMEVLSHGKLGGPFRAKQDKVNLFVYYFINHKTFFWFDTNKLCDKLEELILTNEFKVKTIKNKGWSAEGYAIPRKLFEDVQIRVDVF